MYRVSGTILLVASILGVIFNCHFLLRYIFSRSKYQAHLHYLPILIGMICSSLMVLIIVMPIFLLELFTCQTYSLTTSDFTEDINTKSGWMCRLQGLTCFANGTFNIYSLALLSFARYVRLQFNLNSPISRLIHKRCACIVGAVSSRWPLSVFWQEDKTLIIFDLNVTRHVPRPSLDRGSRHRATRSRLRISFYVKFSAVFRFWHSSRSLFPLLACRTPLICN
jgi:hypothetical protein